MTRPAPAIALVGDYSPRVPAHGAIPRAFALIAVETGFSFTWRWTETAAIRDARQDLAAFSAVWLVPASPYKNMAGALSAVRWARETRRPFLGTCGGFQHALIEFARNVAGLNAADHAETNPAASVPLITHLGCSLDRPAPVHFAPGSLIREAYARASADEGYRCSFGPNPVYRGALEGAGLRFTAFDDDGAIRAAELLSGVHPFFVGTLFQPERAALLGEIPPLVRAFVQATILCRFIPLKLTGRSASVFPSWSNSPETRRP
jgi:CTP synthase (UTP-ammonia lyase)